jgi:hypothetical protein
VRIGEYVVEESDKKHADTIVTKFLGQDAEILKGEAPSGRNGSNNRNFCLYTNILQNVGIKRKFREYSDLDVELVVRDIRDKLNFSGFKIDKIKGFPIDGNDWRNGCLLISDWGKEGVRIDLKRLERNQIDDDVDEFLRNLHDLTHVDITDSDVIKRDDFYVKRRLQQSVDSNLNENNLPVSYLDNPLYVVIYRITEKPC